MNERLPSRNEAFLNKPGAIRALLLWSHILFYS